MLTTENLAIGYENGRSQTLVATNLHLALKPGRLVCLLGPNGVGKSTLLRTLAGMQRPLRGTVRLNGEDVHALPPQSVAKRLSVVLTERIDVGMLSAYALVALGRHPYTGWGGKLSAADERIVQDAIAAVSAEQLANRYVNELSDGERQKIMIARALAQSSQVMLLDEPTAYLDLPRRVEIVQILRRLAHRSSRAVLLSTHDLDLALRSADEVWLMENGRLHVGSPEDLVLDGTFAAAFASEGVTFDAEKGAFAIANQPKGRIGLSGSGLAATWTARALERAGYEIARGDNAAPYGVEITEDGLALVGEKGRIKVGSIAELLEALASKERPMS